MGHARSRARLPLVALLLAVLPAVAAGGWLDVDYGPLVDRRQLSHSGESVGALLDRLGGRPVPTPGERPADRTAHALLEPLVEPYGFVLADALDRVAGRPARPLVELGWLWQPGQSQPAWAELLRARRYLVESDGAGFLRICLPSPVAAADAEPAAADGAAARAAWQAAWPVLRHVLAAERRRLQGDAERPPALRVRVHAYRHQPERSRFLLDTFGFETTVDDTRPTGLRPPLDLDAWQAFLASGLQLEGARVDADGRVTLLGSRVEQPPTLLGRRLTLEDFAVAYRAVVHGGLSEPYMSLDRGFSPQISLVNYGGRLRDTALGLVSLLCDIRFKTFSLGLDIVEGADVRPRVREGVPEFRTHMERFAADPASRDVVSQQTRLWFYPDRVDLTVSAQADVLVLRRVRMSAASERVEEGTMIAAGEREDPPWTRATVEAIDRDYDRLAAFFPELADLDQVVRLLSLFTWLREIAAAGQRVPELEALLALELPPLTTPRTYPQLLAFIALPEQAGTDGAVAAFDRVPIAEALERLNPIDGRPLPARLRIERALAALDARDPQNVALRREYEGYDLDRLDDSALDLLAFRAERLRMHQTVLATLERPRVESLQQRQAAGESLRVFSVGIGGLDLGMGQVLARAGGQSLTLLASAASEARPAARMSDLPAGGGELWRHDPTAIGAAVTPAHGIAAGTPPASYRQRFGDHWIEAAAGESGRWVRVVLGASSPEVRARRVWLDDDNRPEHVERSEGAHAFGYRLESSGTGLVARPLAAPAEAPSGGTAAETVAPGLATLMIGTPGAPAEAASTSEVRVRLAASPGGTPRSLEASLPREMLQRLVLGRVADRTPGAPLPLATLPPTLGDVVSVMVLARPGQLPAPWERRGSPVPGEEHPLQLARALGEWAVAGETSFRGVVAGVDPAVSPARWLAAPRPSGTALLVMPEGPEVGLDAELASRLRAAWPTAAVVGAVPQRTDAEVVVVVDGTAPGVAAARVREIARSPALAGKLLAVWCLSGPLRPDVPAHLLAETELAGIGVADSNVVGLREAADSLRQFADAVSRNGDSGRRVEELPGPFLWQF